MLTKLVNGVRVVMTPEEEREFKDLREMNKLKFEKKIIKKNKKEKAMDKLLSSLTEEEKELLKPSLMGNN